VPTPAEWQRPLGQNRAGYVILQAVASKQRLSLAAKRLFSADEIVGWLLYAFGTVELVFAWPWPRAVGAAAIALGLIDHGRGVARGWNEADLAGRRE
jgi:hypothetical protein